jgi:NADPH-dependent ferric siderophore reductase
MVADPFSSRVGQPGGPLADATMLTLTVRDFVDVIPTYRRIVLESPDLVNFAYQPGQDLMLRIPGEAGDLTNRRYTIRAADGDEGVAVVDMVLHGEGPAARWGAAVTAGAQITAIGPRGKIFVDESADWHLFIGDESALPAMAAMVESIGTEVPATVVAEIPEHALALEPTLATDSRVELLWLVRGSAPPGEAERLLDVAGQLELLPGRGQAYLAGEMRVVRALSQRLIERGLASEQISAKSYWRRGGPNAAHGEPIDPDMPRQRRT